MAGDTTTLRKRQQIEKAGRTMFMWVAIAAAMFGVAAVLSLSLFQRLSYNQEVINKKNETLGNLRYNNEIVDELKENVRVLNTNDALLSTDRSEGSEPITVVLDALPSQANSAALGASLQQKLFNVENVSVESLIVDQVGGGDASESKSTTSSNSNEITFTFSVSTSKNQASSLKQVLTNIEKSIRAIDITSLEIEQQNDTIVLSGEGRSFFEPEMLVEMGKEQV